MAHFSSTLRFEPPYDQAFKGILYFKRLSDAEETIRQLEKLRRQYLAADDDKGSGYCRQVALKGRRRSELISRNPKVNPVKRMQKREIAYWFQLWLEAPALFEDWLILRKQTQAFRELQESEDLEDAHQDTKSHENRG